MVNGRHGTNPLGEHPYVNVMRVIAPLPVSKTEMSPSTANARRVPLGERRGVSTAPVAASSGVFLPVASIQFTVRPPLPLLPLRYTSVPVREKLSCPAPAVALPTIS